MSSGTLYARDLMEKLLTDETLKLLEILFSEDDQEKILDTLLGGSDDS